SRHPRSINPYTDLKTAPGSQLRGKDEISSGAFRAHDNSSHYDVTALNASVGLPRFRAPLRQPKPYRSDWEREFVFVWRILASR
ncbi:MAG TPA: hypothetical protein VG324_11825, partial [Blastocatellia bacterium]|nr:hypothetical protein [Blastocatellia bacterium]